MSYDLYFRGESDLDVVREHFEDRGYRVDDEQAFFENKATGVYWSFSFGGEDYPLAFNLNYFRPHVFGLEAERAVTELVRELELAIHDPSMNGMADGPYTADGFLRGWNAGNRFAHRAFAETEDAERLWMAPATRNAAVWRWNYAKEAASDEIESLIDEAPPCFVPTVMTIVKNGERAVKTSVLWDLDMAIMIPEVDLVMSGTDRGLIAAPRAEVVALLDRHSQWRADYQVGPDLPIGMTADLFDQSAPGVTKRLQALMRPLDATRISADEVLDEEMIAEAFG